MPQNYAKATVGMTELEVSVKRKNKSAYLITGSVPVRSQGDLTFKGEFNPETLDVKLEETKSDLFKMLSYKQKMILVNKVIIYATEEAKQHEETPFEKFNVLFGGKEIVDPNREITAELIRKAKGFSKKVTAEKKPKKVSTKKVVKEAKPKKEVKPKKEAKPKKEKKASTKKSVAKKAPAKKLKLKVI